MNELEKLRGREFSGIEELAAAASRIVEQYTNEPARGNLRLGITQRIVRHYLSEGLLGTPTLTASTNSDKIRVGDFNRDGRPDVAGIGWGTTSRGNTVPASPSVTPPRASVLLIVGI